MSTILIISPEPWDGHFVSKHHYARELARRGHKVLFHGPPDPAGHMRLQPVSGEAGDLHVLHGPRVAPGLRFMPGALRRGLEKRWLAKVERLAGQHIDVVWNFENSRFYDMRFAGHRLKIYQQVDLNQDFHPAQAAATADLSIALSAPIAQRLKAKAANLIRMTHGHASQLAAKPLSRDARDDFDAAAVNAVMVGNLDIAYLDIALVTRLVTTHPDVRFHFIGSYSPDAELYASLGTVPNAIFWGRQPSGMLPDILERADVLLLAYLADQYRDQLANPHKMMEYLASGRCVLATRTLDYEDRPDLVEMAADHADYLQRFAAITADPAQWNSPARVAERRAFAAQNTYPRQIDRIIQALGPRGILLS